MAYNAEYFKKRWREDPVRRVKNRLYKHKARFGVDVDEMREKGECTVCGMKNIKTQIE